jgi:carboxyl-terminal processing protease
MPLTTFVALLTLAQAQATEDFSRAWSQTEASIRTRYYARDERKGEMEALLAKYGPIASKAKDRNEFRDTVVRMIDEFGDSHFDFLTPSDQGFYTLGELVPGGKARTMPHVGAWFERTDAGFRVQMVLEGMEAQRVGLLQGDILLTADGKPFTPVDSLTPLVGKEVTFTFRRRAEVRTVTMKVEESEGMALFLQASRNSGRIIESGGKKYAYFHLWTMAKEEFRNALSSFVYGRAMQTDGFILDIRDGFGGRPEGYADPFFRPEAKLEWEVGGTSVPQYFGYGKPLVLIINKGSRSAKEVLAFILKKSKRAVLVGEPTGGNVLGTSPLMLGDWAVVEIPMVDLTVDDVRLEGVGVDPDFLVLDSPTADGRDPYIERALEALAMRH